VSQIVVYLSIIRDVHRFANHHMEGHNMNTEAKKPEARFTTKIKKDAEWNEWQVRLYEDGIFVDNSTYHTTDYQDASDTAQEMVTHAHNRSDHGRHDVPEKVTPMHEYEVTYTVTVSALSESNARDVALDKVSSSAYPGRSINEWQVKRLKRSEKSRTSMTMQEELDEYGGNCIFLGDAEKAGVSGWRYKRILYSQWTEQYKMFADLGAPALKALKDSVAEVWHITDSAYVWVQNRKSA
jgi:hypothetical protein